MFIADVVSRGLNDREKSLVFALEKPFRNLICGPVNYGRGRVVFGAGLCVRDMGSGYDFAVRVF